MRRGSYEQGNPEVLLYCPYGQTGGGRENSNRFAGLVKDRVGPRGLRVVEADTRGGLRSYWSQLVTCLRLQDQLQHYRLVIIQGFINPGSWLLGRGCARHGVPYVVVPHGDLIPTTFIQFRVARNALLKWVWWLLAGRRLLSRAAAVVVSSRLEKERLVQAGAARCEYRVIPNPIPSGIAEASAGYDRTETDPHGCILWMGRIAREKGLELLIECWPEVLRQCPAARLILAGSVYDRRVYANLLRRRSRLRLESSVLFRPYLRNGAKADALHRARCLVLPSHFECFGIVVLEALLAGTPVLVSTGTPWAALPPVAGRAMRRSRSLWVAAMVEYLSHPVKQVVPPHDVRQIVAPFDADTIMRQWGNLFDRWVPAGSPSSAPRG